MRNQSSIKQIKFFVLFLLFSFYAYNCENRIPKYLTIDVNRTEHVNEVYEFLQDNIFHILTEYPNNRETKADFDDLFEAEMKNLVEPKTWHITVLNINEDKSKLNSEIYKNFVENQLVEINISTLIYVPGKIMVAPVFLDFAGIENTIPHVTLILGKNFRPIDGNFILNSLFIENRELRALYDEGFIKDPSFQINLELNHVRVIYEDKKKQEFLNHVYLIKYDSHLKLKGITKKIYE